MRIDILSAVPELLDSFLNYSIIKRAQANKTVEIFVHDLHEYSDDKNRRIDDYPYGGTSGMIMNIQPIEKAISELTSNNKYDEIIFPTPDAPKYEQKDANRFSTLNNIIIICGHYKGIDQRIRDHFVTKEISVGDYVLTGGELAAAIIVDSVVRLIPGSISDETSALTDSFQDNLLSPPVYTRPADYKGWKVPEVLLSGNHKDIEEWNMQQAVEKTKKIKPDLLKGNN